MYSLDSNSSHFLLFFNQIDVLELPVDKEKNRRRGFCFISFDSSDVVETLCASQKHHVGGRDVSNQLCYSNVISLIVMSTELLSLH